MTMNRLALKSHTQLVYYLHGVGKHVLGWSILVQGVITYDCAARLTDFLILWGRCAQALGKQAMHE